MCVHVFKGAICSFFQQEKRRWQDHPKGQSDDSLKEEWLILVEEMKKKTTNKVFINQKKSLTFSLWRKEIVEVVPMVSEVLERWPALFLPNEVK